MKWPWTRYESEGAAIRSLRTLNVELYVALARVRATEAELTTTIQNNDQMIKMLEVIRTSNGKETYERESD